MGKREETMRFLVTSLGNEDLILGYPCFEPQFNWMNGVIDTWYLPVVIRSLNWTQLKIRPTIATLTTQDREPPLTMLQQMEIHKELAHETNVWANNLQNLLNKPDNTPKKWKFQPTTGSL